MTLQHKQGWYTPAWQPIYLTIHFHRISLKMKSSTFPSVYLAVPSGWGAPILLFPAQQHPCRHQAQLLVGPYGDASAPLCMLMAFATQAHSKHWSDFLSLVPEYSKNTKPQIKELNELSAWFRSIQNLRAAFCALRHSLTFNSNCERKKKNALTTSLQFDNSHWKPSGLNCHSLLHHTLPKLTQSCSNYRR